MSRSRTLPIEASEQGRPSPRPPLGGFAQRVIDWQGRHGRHDLPWQRSRNPYAVWISEIMLQQTQVATVIPYYQRFLQRFPDVGALASASVDQVMQLWSGLGYYSRARNLHRAANEVAKEHAGVFPHDATSLGKLPGVGRSTAAAIAALAFGSRCAILDGNVKRVLCRYFAVAGDPSSSAVERDLWALAERLVPQAQADVYTQGMMDIGATVCLRQRPKCSLCPLAADCAAHRSGRVDRFPQRRQRAALPEREVAMFVLHHRAEVMLQKRPPHGIWGGLWSLPEADPEHDPVLVCESRFGARAAEVRALPVVKHGFTHFRLRIRPWRIDVRTLAPRAAESGIMWLPLGEARDAALPAPVRR
ncbi:MAG: A/G-specific adenine glycosylase, partial [Betaproteobacteria bacterium]